MNSWVLSRESTTVWCKLYPVPKRLDYEYVNRAFALIRVSMYISEVIADIASNSQ